MSWTWKLALIFCLCLIITNNAQYYEEDPYSCAPDNVKYEWERLNYYEMLGFSGSAHTNESLDSKSIRKAYRQQAQLWHPDKVKANETLTIEEINARFSQIAQAYETLNSPEKRHSYDRFLVNCESRRGQKPPPWQDTASTNTNGNPYHNQHQHQQRQYGYNSAPSRSNAKSNPSSIRKETDMLIDPMTGAPIMRETIYEEYAAEGVYRISIMDYLIQQMDAWGNSYYQPLYPYPRVVEEGPLHEYDQETQSGNSDDYDEPPVFSSTSNTLEEGSVLRGEEMLVSDNDRYRARVVNCRLVIESRRTSAIEEDDEDPTVEPDIFEVIWQSDNEIPFFAMRQEPECFLALEGGRLMIAGGSPEYHTGEILWYSTIRDTHDGEDTFFFASKTYHAKLEDDGKLAVYLGTSLDIEDEPTCVYATGPLGCVRYVSQLLHILRTARDGIDIGPLQRLFDFDEDPDADSGEDASDEEDNIFVSSMAAAKRKFRDMNRLAREKCGPLFNKLCGFGEDHDREEDNIVGRSLRAAKRTFKEMHRLVRENLGPFLTDLFDFDEEPGTSSDDEAFGNYQEENYDNEGDSRFLSLLFGTARRVNRIRRGVEESLEQKTTQWVHNSILRWQKYRAGR